MNVILFDPKNREALYPIVLTRPFSTVRVGMLTIKEKWEVYLGKSCSVLAPKYLTEKYKTEYSAENLYINASIFPTKELFEEILSLRSGEELVKENQLIAFYAEKISWEDLPKITEDLLPVESKNEVISLKNTWDIIRYLKSELHRDFELVADRFSEAEFLSYTTAINCEKIKVGQNVKLGACILNASEGEIIIDDEAEIMDGAMVKGPIYLGKHSCIKMGAKIYGPVAIGEHCKVGGEVYDSILQAYSNKGHDGFLGHSYLGEWCNLGADTNISNLKNNYEPVRIWNYATGSFSRTGMQFLGLIMGDHSRTGINTMLNTGTVIGVACNVYGSGFPRNFIPDFTIGSAHKIETFPLKKVHAMAKNMMERRKMELSSVDEKVLETAFDMTLRYRK